jgi:hypothetical protein
MLQSHGINPGKELIDEEHKESQGSMPGHSSANNLFNKKKENLEDKARILELIN